jgi:hypothetical protein
MKIKELLTLWESTAKGSLTHEEFTLHLPIEDAAKIQALVEMYPRRSANDIIMDLLTAALNDVEAHLPYVKGVEVVGKDEEGNPVYEDAGPTPLYLDLTQKHINQYLQSSKGHH